MIVVTWIWALTSIY